MSTFTVESAPGTAVRIVEREENNGYMLTDFVIDVNDIPQLIDTLQAYYNQYKNRVHPMQGQLFDPDNY